jgi:hypothetical protein
LAAIASQDPGFAMAYFIEQDLLVLQREAGQPESGAWRLLVDKLLMLDQALQRHAPAVLAQMAVQRMPGCRSQVRLTSVAHNPVKQDPRPVASITYRRNDPDSLHVERMMGREQIARAEQIDAQRHVSIELRLMETGLVLELVETSDAWWDQMNLAGKRQVAVRDQELVRLIQSLPTGLVCGFWRGMDLDELHLHGAALQRPGVLRQWLDTFEPERDWLRIGYWYPHDHPDLSCDAIQPLLVERFNGLLALYDYIAWSPENNYHGFIG